MKTYTYYIYHIPGIKIGCTTEIEKRMRDQGFTNWEILWQQDGDLDFGWTAGDKEIELQKQYGLPIDNVHYQISRSHRRDMGISGGKSKSAIKLEKLKLNRITWKETTKYRDRDKVIENARKNGGTHKHRDCQYCGRTINLMNIGRHENICKNKV